METAQSRLNPIEILVLFMVVEFGFAVVVEVPLLEMKLRCNRVET